MNKKIVYRVTFSRNGYTRKDGTKEVVITCSQYGKTIQLGTKIYVNESQLENGFIKNHKLSTEYNEYLYELKNRFERLELDYIINGKDMTLSALRRQINDGMRRNMLLSEFIENMNKASTARCNRTKANYKSLINQINQFAKDITLDDVDIDFLNSFVKYSKEKHMAHNTIVVRLKSLKCVINEAIKRKLINADNDPFISFKIPSAISKEEHLTYDELKEIENIKLLNDDDKKIRDSFLFACYTGLRFSDLNTIETDNIHIINGKKWIIKRPVKTMGTSSIIVKIPIYRMFGGKALQLINEYGSVENLCHIGNNAIANKILKQIINNKTSISNKRHITFHAARHTCATLLLSQGVPITTVQSILGHTKVSTTQIYAKITPSTIEKDIEKAFKNV